MPTYNVSLPSDLNKEVTALAEKENVSPEEEIRILCREALQYRKR